MNLATAQAKFYGLGIAGVVAAIFAVGYLVKGWGGSSAPKIDPKTQHSIDSLTVTKPAFDSTQKAAAQRVAHDTIVTIIHDKASNVALAAARTAQARADSLATEASRAADSATAWHRAYDARTTEATGLRVAVAEKDSALTSERDARITLARTYGADTLRRIAIERVNRGLQDDIAKLEQPCHIVGPIGCPSRTTTGVIAALLGAGAGYVVHR